MFYSLAITTIALASAVFRTGSFVLLQHKRPPSPLSSSLSTPSPPEEGDQDEQIKLDFYRRMKPLSSSNGDGVAKKLKSTLPNLPPGMDPTITKEEQSLVKSRELARESSDSEEPKSDMDILRDQMKKLLERM